MASTPRHSPPAIDGQKSLQRDVALGRIGSVTKAVGAATVAAVALVGVYVSKALPGHTTAPSSGATSPAGASGGLSSPSTGAVPGGSAAGGGSSSNLTPPTAAPAPVQRQSPVVSGAS